MPGFQPELFFLVPEPINYRTQGPMEKDPEAQ